MAERRRDRRDPNIGGLPIRPATTAILVALMLSASSGTARATSIAIGPACHSALAPRLCAIHHAVHRTNLIRVRKGYLPLAYHWLPERQRTRRPYWIWVWRTHLAQAQFLPVRSPWLSGSWYAAAMCVHGGEGAWNANTGNGYTGGMQFLDSTWLSNGGGAYAPHAYLATPAEQLRVSYHLWRAAGWNPWPTTARACGLL